MQRWLPRSVCARRNRRHGSPTTSAPTRAGWRPAPGLITADPSCPRCAVSAAGPPRSAAALSGRRGRFDDAVASRRVCRVVSDRRRSAPRNALRGRGADGDPGCQGYQGRLELVVDVDAFSLWEGSCWPRYSCVLSVDPCPSGRPPVDVRSPRFSGRDAPHCQRLVECPRIHRTGNPTAVRPRTSFSLGGLSTCVPSRCETRAEPIGIERFTSSATCWILENERRSRGRAALREDNVLGIDGGSPFARRPP